MAGAERLDVGLRVRLPAALVVAERPQRRRRRAAGQPRVGLDDRPAATGRRRRTRCTGRPRSGSEYSSGSAEVVGGAVAVVDEGRRDLPVGRVVMEERDRDVVRVEVDALAVTAERRGRVRVEDVGVPEREAAAAPVVAPGLLAQAVDRVPGLVAAAHPERVVERAVGLDRLDHRRAVGAADVERLEVDLQRGGAQRRPVDLELRAAVVDDRERRRLVEHAAAADLEPHHVVADHVDPQPLPPPRALHAWKIKGSDPFKERHRRPPRVAGEEAAGDVLGVVHAGADLVRVRDDDGPVAQADRVLGGGADAAGRARC